MDGVQCPSTSTEIQRRSETLRCSTDSPYHCLRNEKGQLMEKCIESSWIQSGYCAEYNVKAMRMDAKPCDRNLGICPDKTYFSSKVISYSACVQPLNTPKPSLVPGQYSTTADLASDRSNENPATSLLPLLIILSFLLFLAIIAGGFIYIRRRRRKRKDSSNVDTEERTELVQKSSALKEENYDDDFFISNDETKTKIPDEQSKPIHEQKLQLDFFDNSQYIELRVAQTLCEWIKSGDSVLIVGNPGSGKTSLAWNTCVKFHNISSDAVVYQVLTFCSFEEIPSEFDSEKKTLLFLDECFEIWNSYPRKVDSYIKGMKKVLEMKAKYGNIQLIITMSSFTFNNIQCDQAFSLSYEKIFPSFQLLHLSKKDWPDALDIGNLCRAHHIEDKENVKNRNNTANNNQCYKGITEELKFMKNNIGAPLSLCIFSRQKRAIKKVGDFFRDPFHYVIEDVVNLRKSKEPSEQSKYCTLIYFMLRGGITDIAKVDTELLRVIGEVSDISQPTLNVDHYLLRQREDGRYELLHESILRLLFKCFGNRCPHILLNHCDPKTMMRYLRTNDKEWKDVYRKNELLVIETPETLTFLADKVKRREIDLTSHIILRDKAFCKMVQPNNFV